MEYEAINDKAAPRLSHLHWSSCLAGEEFIPAGFIMVGWSLVLNAGQKLKIMAPNPLYVTLQMTRLQMERNVRRSYQINEDITTTTHVEHNVPDLLSIISKALTFQKSGDLFSPPHRGNWRCRIENTIVAHAAWESATCCLGNLEKAVSLILVSLSLTL